MVVNVPGGALLVLLGMTTGMFSHPAAAAATESSLGPGVLVLEDSAGSTLAPRLSTRIQVRVEGIAARVTVSQQFFNGSPDWVDGTYVFPLPDSAAVDQLEMVVGERRILGEIGERATARAAHDEARAAGRKTALVEQERPNLFTSSIGNIGPGESIQIEIAYWLQIRYDQGSFVMTIPTTLTPRYLPGSPIGGVPSGMGWATAIDQVADGGRITPPTKLGGAVDSHRFAIQVTLKPGFELHSIHSSSHSIHSENLGASHRVTLLGDPAAMDRDFELVWRLAPSATPEVALFVEQFAGLTHALLLAVPPVGDAQLQPHQGRELILVVDTSGSMHGLALAEAKRALRIALAELAAADTFNLIRFSSVTRRLFPESVPASRANISRAHRYLESLNAEGGTQIAPALVSALKATADEQRLRQVVFITDGSIGNEAAIFDLIAAHLGNGRLFTVGLGAAPNAWFMRKAAEFGRGTYTLIPTIDQVGPRMGALLDRLKGPQVTELSVDWPADGAEAFPPRLPDLYSDQPLVVLTRLPASAGLVTVAGRSPDGYWLRQDMLPVAGSPGIAQLWARAKVESLLDRQMGSGGESTVREAVLATGLGYGLVTPFTALVAVDKTPSRPAYVADARQRAVPGLLPYGQRGRGMVGFPNTATHLWLKILLGLIALGVSGGLFWGATWGVARP